MNKIFFKILTLIVFLIPVISYSKTTSCPSQNFPKFLKAYQNDISIQKKFTISPLKTNVYYPDFGEKPNVSYLKTTAIEFPVLMNQKDRAEQGVSLQIKKQSSRWYKVFTRSQGSGAYSFDFDFKYSNACWRLVESTDFST
jgi:hypothetical protein